MGNGSLKQYYCWTFGLPAVYPSAFSLLIIYISQIVSQNYFYSVFANFNHYKNTITMMIKCFGILSVFEMNEL